jgi:hypothetical protein
MINYIFLSGLCIIIIGVFIYMMKTLEEKETEIS